MYRQSCAVSKSEIQTFPRFVIPVNSLPDALLSVRHWSIALWDEPVEQNNISLERHHLYAPDLFSQSQTIIFNLGYPSDHLTKKQKKINTAKNAHRHCIALFTLM